MLPPSARIRLVTGLLSMLVLGSGCGLEAGRRALAADPKEKADEKPKESSANKKDASKKDADDTKGDKEGEDKSGAEDSEDAENDKADTNRAAEDNSGESKAKKDDDELGAYRDNEGQRPEAVEDAERELLTALRTRSESLSKDRLALARRDAELQNIQSELKERLSKITELEERLQVQLGIGRAAKDRRAERVTALSELIIKMPPQSGAEIMAQMTDEDAQAILLSIARKEPRKAAQILAQMPASRAAQLGEQYLNTELKLPGSEDLVPKDADNKNPPKGGK